MRKSIVCTIFLLLTVSAFANNNDKANSDKGKKKVLVVSFIEKNFVSTYETSEIAEKNNVDSETILTTLGEKICSSFPKNEGVEFVKCTDKPESIEDNISFSYNKKDVFEPNLSEIDASSVNELLEANNADYVVFINGYEMNWIGDPQFKVENNIHFTILGKDKKEIATKKYSFSTPKLVSLEKMEKKIQKIAKKIYTKYLKKIS